jgi:hypothetical protein
MHKKPCLEGPRGFQTCPVCGRQGMFGMLGGCVDVTAARWVPQKKICIPVAAPHLSVPAVCMQMHLDTVCLVETQAPAVVKPPRSASSDTHRYPNTVDATASATAPADIVPSNIASPRKQQHTGVNDQLPIPATPPPTMQVINGYSFHNTRATLRLLPQALNRRALGIATSTVMTAIPVPIPSSQLWMRSGSPHHYTPCCLRRCCNIHSCLVCCC